MRKIYVLASFLPLSLACGSIASSSFDGGEPPAGAPRQPVRPAEGAAVPQKQRHVPETLVINQRTLLGVNETLEAMTGANKMITRMDEMKRNLPREQVIDQYLAVLKGILTDRHNIYKEVYDDYIQSAQPKQQALSRSERLERNLAQFKDMSSRFLTKLDSFQKVDPSFKASLVKEFKNMDKLLASQYEGVVVVLTHNTP